MFSLKNKVSAASSSFFGACFLKMNYPFCVLWCCFSLGKLQVTSSCTTKITTEESRVKTEKKMKRALFHFSHRDFLGIMFFVFKLNLKQNEP